MTINTPRPVSGATITKAWGDLVVADLTAIDSRITADSRGQIVSRGRRITTSTASASEQSVLRLDGIPVVAGNVYLITTNPVTLDSTVANDVGRINLRIDETGAAATTSSTQIALGQQRLDDAANGNTCSACSSRSATATGSWSVLLSTSRVTGTGNISVVGSSAGPIELYVIDCGPDPGDTGVDL